MLKHVSMVAQNILDLIVITSKNLDLIVIAILSTGA